MSDWYVLDENNKAIKSSVEHWTEWSQKNPTRKVIGKTKIGDDLISTVFLGLEHGYWPDLNILWETMVFGQSCNDQYQERYSSHERAVEGHERIVRAVINGEMLMGEE